MSDDYNITDKQTLLGSFSFRFIATNLLLFRGSLPVVGISEILEASGAREELDCVVMSSIPRVDSKELALLSSRFRFMALPSFEEPWTLEVPVGGFGWTVSASEGIWSKFHGVSLASGPLATGATLMSCLRCFVFDESQLSQPVHSKVGDSDREGFPLLRRHHQRPSS